jgi:hypothetical protein
MNFKNWLLFECCFAFVVSFVGFMEVEGTFKGRQESSSRTTLFRVGGDDTAQPKVVATSCNISSSPTYAKSSWTSKVNPILDSSPIPPLLNGILLHTPSHGYARLMTRNTGAWEEASSAHGLKSDIIEAWKRRKKKHGDRSLRTASDRSLRTLPDRSLQPL